MKRVKVHDKEFEIFISSEKVQERIAELAYELDKADFPTNTLFLGILRGAFLFLSDLVQKMQKDYLVDFVNLSSYRGMKSGELEIGEHAFNPADYETIVIVEDIVDTGRTLSAYKKYLSSKGAKDVKIISLLRKPGAIKEYVNVDWVGFDIPNDFVLGYGMDYDGLGRTYKDIYRYCNESPSK